MHPHTRVPVKQGTMIVFSNYQMIHRVLKIVHSENSTGDPSSPDGYNSRDFMLFFIVDQLNPLKNTEEYRKINIDISNSDNRISNFSDEKKKEIRDKLFQEQIQPRGSFGIDRENIYSTGNGSVAELGLKNSLENNESDEELFTSNNRDGIKFLLNLNHDPPLQRGVSWALSEGINEAYFERQKDKSDNFSDVDC